MVDGVVRNLLLEHELHWGPAGRVEVRRITMAANVGAGLHRHNGPVFGTIERGSVLFQIVGGEPVVLGAGDPFHEPADTVIEHFDATDEGATFFAVFLLHPGVEGELTSLRPAGSVLKEFLRPRRRNSLATKTGQPTRST